jgi:hypothetical protein
MAAEMLLADSLALNARMEAALPFIGINRSLIPPPSTPLDINPSDSDEVNAEKLLKAALDLKKRMESGPGFREQNLRQKDEMAVMTWK